MAVGPFDLIYKRPLRDVYFPAYFLRLTQCIGNFNVTPYGTNTSV